MTDQLKLNAQQRQKYSKYWFVHHDCLYKKHGVNFEDYHKRKFSGGPLKAIKNKAKDIFDDAKDVLREFKETGVSNGDIETLCNETADLLTASNAYFSASFKNFPSEKDIIDTTRKFSYCDFYNSGI